MYDFPDSFFDRLEAERAREYNFQKRCDEIAVKVPFSRDEIESTVKILYDLNHPDAFGDAILVS